LQELYEYVPPLERKRKTKKKATMTTITTRKGVIRTAKNGYKDAMTFFDEFSKNDFTMVGLHRNLVKPMKNATVVEKLNLIWV
jgi:hypothetical protein